ncbi:MAG: acetate--CoA ligase family protein [Candidatus Lokiarchaeia archaeon]
MDPAKYHYFEELFHPKSIAIVGASEQNALFLVPLLEANFPGKVYPVNPNREEVYGLKCYSRILDIDGPIDYVISAVPASLALDLMKQCVEKKVKTVHYFTSGFSETGKPEDVKLEEELVRIARAGGVRIIGPNCMGLYIPESRVTYFYDFPLEGGPIALVSQSGAFAVGIVMLGRARDIRFSKVISFGNAADLDAADFIEYLAEDPKSEVIAAYLEGVKDGRKLLGVLKDTNLRKPVIVLKGGRTSQGARAAASHTGSLAGSANIWDAVLKQLGIITVRTVEELTDTMLAFTRVPKPPGRRILIVSFSGGSSVIQSDICTELGLEIPVLSNESRDKISKIVPTAGTSTKNPLDIPSAYFGTDMISKTLNIAASEDSIDIVLLELLDRLPVFFKLRNAIDGYYALIENLINSSKHVRDVLGKPFLVALPPSFYEDEGRSLKNLFQNEGFPVFPSVDRAAKAISNVLNYYDFIEKESNV